MKAMRDKVCIVTGAAGSIGLAAARRLLAEGGRVMLTDRDEEGLNRAEADLAEFREQTFFFPADLHQAQHIQKMIRTTREQWGRIDVLFSNAGISGVVASIEDYPVDVFDNVLQVNLRAAFMLCKYTLPVIQPGGSIILTSSIMGVTADPGVCAYIVSKHALIGLMRCAAKEAAGRNIRVNVLAPGPVNNPFQDRIEERLSQTIGVDAKEMINRRIPLGRHADAEEIANMVFFLASDHSSFCTGGVYMADGGMHI